jgi:type II secretory pathway predicted ATPase ExeA
MRIVIVHRDIHQVTRGGICTLYRALAPRLAACGHNVTVITQATPHPARALNAELIVLPRTSDLAAHRRAVAAALASTCPDVVDCSTWEAETLDYLQIPAPRRAPVVVRGDLSARTMGAADLASAESDLLHRADQVIAVSAFASRDLAAAYHIPAPRVIRNGVDRDRFRPGPVLAPRSGYRITLDGDGQAAQREPLPNPMIGVRGLHEMIVATFGGQPDRSGSRLTAQASAILAAERDERGKTPVLVIDEAHLLRYEQLETIRMLTNHNLDADSPLAALLVGQPTLRRTMKLAVLAALEQRVALRYAMPPMTSQETTSYITHHLKLAGRADALFSDDAVALIHTTARGYPRAVNNLALQALVATYAAGKAIVDESAARAAVTEATDT